MQKFNFFLPQAIMLPDGLSFPVFQFTEELKNLAPDVNWTIVNKPMAMIDCHVAECYGKLTKNFNTQVERNREYFKDDWRFRPSQEEWKALKLIVSKRFIDVAAKCSHISENESNSEHPNSSPLFQIFGSAYKSTSSPWFYIKKGIDMAAFFQSTPIARIRAMYIVEVFNEFEQAAFDPATDPRVQSYLQKVLAEKLPKSPIEIAVQFEACKKIAETAGLFGNQAILAASNAVFKISGCDPLELLEQKQLTSVPQELHLSPTAIGNMLKISAQKVNKLLEEAHLQESFRDVKDKKCWKTTEKGKKFAVLKDTNKKHKDGRPVQQLMWLESVITILKGSDKQSKFNF